MPTTGQYQRQRQQQKLTPQQLYLLELLSKPVDQIEQIVNDEVMSNPLLDTASLEQPPADLQPTQQKDDNLLSDEYDENDERNYDSYRDYPSASHSVDDRQMPPVIATTSLSENLLDQLRYCNLDDRQQMIAEEIVGSINSSGYFDTDPAIIVNDLASQGYYVGLDEVDRVLRIVQSLEPAGIAAHDAQECLLLQLRRLPSSATRLNAEKIVSRCYTLLENGNKSRIAQTLHLSDNEAAEAFDLISRLTLKPGDGDTAPYLIPDFAITNNGNQLQITLANGNMPQLQFDNDYLSQLQTLNNTSTPLTRQQKEEVSFLNEKKRSADLLIDTLAQRSQTLLHVLQAIVDAQHDYLISGNPADKQPLMQKDIADITGYDPSTISRIVNHKYLQTDFGIIPLDQCFTTGLTTSSGNTVSTDAVKQIIQQAINNEDPRQPLTDEQIADILNQRGYPIARRTIANYRHDLGIPTCHRRRTP